MQCKFLLCCHCCCSLGPRLSANKIQQSTNFIWDISNTDFCAAYWWLEFSSHPQNRLTNSQHTCKFKKEILVLLSNWACDYSLHRGCWPLQSHFISISLYLTLYLPILFLISKRWTLTCPSDVSAWLPHWHYIYLQDFSALESVFFMLTMGERQPVNLDTIKFRNASNLILLTPLFPSYSFCSLWLCVFQITSHCLFLISTLV